MHSADCSTNGSCISPEREQLADDLHALEQDVVDDARARRACPAPRRGRLRGPARSPSTMRGLSRSSTGQPLRSSFSTDADLARRRRSRAASAAGRSRRCAGRRSGRGRPRVCSSGILFSGMIRAACTMAASRPASTHSCRNTELRTWRAAGLEAEADVRQAEDRVDAGQLGLDLADALDGRRCRRRGSPPCRCRA